jgi:hypothetical protein
VSGVKHSPSPNPNHNKEVKPNGRGYSQPNASLAPSPAASPGSASAGDHAAKPEVKEAIRREGKVKLSRVPQREITARARERVMADAAYRARLIAQAKQIVEEWREGHFGKAAQHQFERNSKHSSNSRRPAAQRLPLNECHAQNGAAK